MTLMIIPIEMKDDSRLNLEKDEKLVSNEKQEGGGKKSGRGNPRKQTNV